MVHATTERVRLPPAPPIPKIAAAVGFVGPREKTARALAKRYGPAFTLDLPILGKTVLIGDPPAIKDLFAADTELVGKASILGMVFGPGSTFSLDGDEHRQRRKLLVSPFHGKRMQGYEQIVEEEAMREIATWPEGQEFPTLQPMLRITLNAILRALFGAEGEALDELRDLLPPAVAFGSRVAVLPAFARRDLGRWSPGGRLLRYRRRFDEIVRGMITQARSDPVFDERTDVLSLLLQARDENGEPIPDGHVADELLTLLAAGHETTATTLAWMIERLRRHPRLLTRLTEEADAGGSELRQATIWEVQRTRSVLDGTFRITRKRIRLGEWVIPENHVVVVSIQVAHASEGNFRDATVFNPDRFVGANPDTQAWIPYGGGVRRCIGAAFANMEMNVTLRTLLREFELGTTDAKGERIQSRGVANAPGRGGRAVVYRRFRGRAG